jgi:hypothetical protein
MFNGRRQPSRGGTSRMTRECQVRICEKLGVKFPGPTRHFRQIVASSSRRGARTIEQLRTQFAEAYEVAKELSQPTAMVAATTAQAKLAGLWIERSEQTRKQPDVMSDAEISAILRGNPN